MKIYSEWERDCGSVVTKIFCASSRDCRHLLAGFFMHHSLLETRRTRIHASQLCVCFLCVTTARALFVLIHLPSLLWSNNGSITLINEKTAIVMAAQLTLSTPAFFPVVFYFSCMRNIWTSFPNCFRSGYHCQPQRKKMIMRTSTVEKKKPNQNMIKPFQ